LFKEKNQIIVPLIVIIETINVLAREGFNQMIVNEVFNKLLKDNAKKEHYDCGFS
jgi:predicted nucleic-acid-binding protein